MKSTESARTACIVCNGTLTAPDEARRLASGVDLVIAVDGGANHLAALGVKPAAIIGDLDSLTDNPWASDESVDHVVFPVDKDKSDTELAVEWAFQRGCRNMVLLAAVGGRMDHTLANFALLLRYPGQVTIRDNGVTLIAVRSGQCYRLQCSPGTCVSIIPWGAEETRIRTTGLKYALQDEALRHVTHGLSNEVVGADASVLVVAGTVLVSVEDRPT